MKYILSLIVLLFFYSTKLNAQDEVDSAYLERIDFSIKKEKLISDSIYFSFFDDTKLLKSKLRLNPNYKQWRYGIGGGYGVRIAPDLQDIPEDLLKHRKGLRFGMVLDADASYFFNPNIGCGLRYSLFKTSNKTNNISYKAENETIYEGNRSDNLNVHFMGPYVSIRSIPKNNKVYASCDFTLGYTVCTNTINFNDYNFNVKGNNFGFSSSVGADFMISNDFSVGLSLNILAASIKKIKLSESSKIRLSEDEIENLSRVSLVLVFRNYR